MCNTTICENTNQSLMRELPELQENFKLCPQQA